MYFVLAVLYELLYFKVHVMYFTSPFCQSFDVWLSGAAIDDLQL